MSNARDKANIPALNFSSTGIDDNATSTAITINSSNNVGIGTTNPAQLLEIYGTSPNVQWTYSGDGNNHRIFSFSDDFYIRADANNTGAGNLVFQNGGSSERMRITSAGDVQIANTNKGSSATREISIGSTSVDGGITLWSRTTGEHGINFGDGYTGTDRYRGAIAYRHTEDDMYFRTSSVERMRIDSSGKVGIGETSMDALLVIKGNSDSSTTPSIRLKDGTDAREAFVTNHSGDLIMATTNSSDDAIDSAIKIFTSQMIFSVDNNTERMRIESNGFTKHSNTGVYDTYSAADDAHQFVSDNQTHATLWVTNTNASYSDIVQKNETARTPNSAFSLLTTTTGNLTDDQHRLRGDGNAYCDGSWNGGGADYAEYFEWSDGNTNNEDRVGYSVVLDGNKIRKATSEDNTSNIIGVVSGNPFVVGDDAWSKWHEKYLKDDFGRYILEEYTITEWQEEITENETTKTISKSFETDKIPSDEIIPENATVLTHEVNGDILKRRILNPNFDETSEYITREDRKEWDTVGLLGKVRIRKTQPVKDTWIKMRDISETVEEWLIK